MQRLHDIGRFHTHFAGADRRAEEHDIQYTGIADICQCLIRIHKDQMRHMFFQIADHGLAVIGRKPDHRADRLNGPGARHDPAVFLQIRQLPHSFTWLKSDDQVRITAGDQRGSDDCQTLLLLIIDPHMGKNTAAPLRHADRLRRHDMPVFFHGRISHES